jgi:hypothetical protein
MKSLIELPGSKWNLWLNPDRIIRAYKNGPMTEVSYQLDAGGGRDSFLTTLTPEEVNQLIITTQTPPAPPAAGSETPNTSRP